MWHDRNLDQTSNIPRCKTPSNARMVCLKHTHACPSGRADPLASGIDGLVRQGLVPPGLVSEPRLCQPKLDDKCTVTVHCAACTVAGGAAMHSIK